MSLSLEQVVFVHPNGTWRRERRQSQHWRRCRSIGSRENHLAAAFRHSAASDQRRAQCRAETRGGSTAADGRTRSRIGTALPRGAPIPPRQRVVYRACWGPSRPVAALKGLASLIYPVDIAGAHEMLGAYADRRQAVERDRPASGGQLQRVGVARVLYQRPATDEPVSAVDPALSDHVIGELNPRRPSRAA